MVSLTYKNYGDGYKQKRLTRDAKEFLRCYKQQTLPKKFTKNRTYGYLVNRNRREQMISILAKIKLPLHKDLIQIPIDVRLMESYVINMKAWVSVKN